MRVLHAIACLLIVTASTNGDGYGFENLVYAPKHASLDYYTYPKYSFEYAVRDPSTGDNKAQWEKRDGDVVIGSYSLVEPDGSIRVVEYRADDKTGFNAIVKRIGPNLHPVTVPIYKAPIPILGGKSIAPIAVGPVAGIKGLAGAPLLGGNLYKGAVSTSSLLTTPIIKGPIGPIIPGPIIKEPIIPIYKDSLPIIKEPLYPGPIIKEPLLGPIIKGPLYGPIIKEPIYGPVIKEPIYSPIIKEPLYGPIIKEPLYGPIIKEPLYGPIIKEPILGPIIKEPIYGPIIKGPLLGQVPLPLLGKYGGLNLDYESLGKGILNKGGLGLAYV